MKKYKSSGWYNESRRHSLARQGIKTGRKVNYTSRLLDEGEREFIDMKLRQGYGIKEISEMENLPLYLVKHEKERMNYSKTTDMISGGLSDNMPDSSFNSEQIQKGIRVELEHTHDPKLAKEIAKDHLIEHPRYYDYLEEMEQRMEPYFIDYQQEVIYEPVTVQLHEPPVVVDIGDTEKQHEREERIRQAGIRTRQALVSGTRGLVRGTGKVAKGVVSTIVSGLKWEPDDDEPKIPPGTMGMGRERAGLSWSKAGGLGEPDNPTGMKHPNYSKKMYRKVIPLGYGRFVTQSVNREEMLKYIKRHNPKVPKKELVKILKTLEIKR